MNKKQLICAWVLAIIMILFIIKGGFKYDRHTEIVYSKKSELSHFFIPLNRSPLNRSWRFVNNPDIRITLSLIILGSLLIYTLKDKKK